MASDDVELGVGEATRLVQNRVGDVEFADVVENGGQPDPAQCGRSEPEFLADEHGEFGGANHVVAGDAVLRLEVSDEAVDDRVEADLERAERLGDEHGR